MRGWIRKIELIAPFAMPMTREHAMRMAMISGKPIPRL